MNDQRWSNKKWKLQSKDEYAENHVDSEEQTAKEPLKHKDVVENN